MLKKTAPLPDKLKPIFDMLAQAREDENIAELESASTQIQGIIDQGTDEEKYECLLRLLESRYGLVAEPIHHDLTTLCACAEPKVKYGYLQNRVFSIVDDPHVMLYLQTTTGGFLDFKTVGELVTQLDALKHRAYRQIRPYPAPAALQ